MLALIGRHQFEIYWQFVIHIRHYMQPIAEPGFLDDFFFAVGIGAALLVTAPSGIRIRGQLLAASYRAPRRSCGLMYVSASRKP